MSPLQREVAEMRDDDRVSTSLVRSTLSRPTRWCNVRFDPHPCPVAEAYGGKVNSAPMQLTCEACGTSAPSSTTGHAESESWHATETGGHICPACWRKQRGNDRTVQAARQLGFDGAEDRADEAVAEQSRERRKQGE
jgi:hypothetical protein